MKLLRLRASLLLFVFLDIGLYSQLQLAATFLCVVYTNQKQ